MVTSLQRQALVGHAEEKHEREDIDESLCVVALADRVSNKLHQECAQNPASRLTGAGRALGHAFDSMPDTEGVSCHAEIKHPATESNSRNIVPARAPITEDRDEHHDVAVVPWRKCLAIVDVDDLRGKPVPAT